MRAKPDLTDRASEEIERAFELRTRDRERKLINKIDEALKRIEDFDYPNWGETITKPVLLLSAGKDLLVDSDKNELICSSISDRSISRINGKHELLMEENDIRNETWKAIDEFLKKIYE